MSLVSSANLPSYFRGNPGNRRDRPTSFGWDLFILYTASALQCRLQTNGPVNVHYQANHQCIGETELVQTLNLGEPLV